MKRRWLTVLAATLSGLAMVAGYNWGPQALATAQALSMVAPQAQEEQVVAALAQPAQARPWLGIQISDADNGAKVDSVVPGSPAAAALKAGDVITAVDGQAISNTKQLIEVIAQRKSGDEVALTITRDNADQEVTVTLGDQPAAPARPRIAPIVPNPLPPFGSFLPEWRDLVPIERLERFQGGSFSFTDKNEQLVTVEMAAGTVTAVAADSVTIKPNGESADRSYQIGEQTRMVPGNRALLTETVLKDDLVMVIARRTGDAIGTLAIYDQTAIEQRRGLPKLREQRPNGERAPDGRGFHFQMPKWPSLRPSGR